MNLWADFLTNDARAVWKWKHYFPIYEEHFRGFVNKPVIFIEIGVASGGSLQMWKRYFGPYATIVGIDISPECKAYEEDQIEVRIGPQQDAAFLREVIDEFGSPDIVLDDGSHVMSHQISSFQFLYPLLTKSGVYMVEDLHTSYWSEFEGGLRKAGTFIELSKDLIDELNGDHTRESLPPTDFTRRTLSMHFYDSVAVFQRGIHTLKWAPRTGRTSYVEHVSARVPPPPVHQIEISEVSVQVFPCIAGVHSQETSQVRRIIPGAWDTLLFDLSDANTCGPLRIDPGSEPSFIEVGDILIHSGKTGELLWSSPGSSPDRDFQLGGTALPHPTNRSFVINVGDDPNLLLNTAPEVRAPFQLTITLKVTPIAEPAMEMVHVHLQTALVEAAQQLVEAAQQLTATAQQRDALASQLTQTIQAKEEVQNELAKTQRELGTTGEELAKTHREFGKTYDGLVKTQDELAKMRELLAAVENSVSWRITSPVRKLRAALRSGQR